jgi:hypothetical protein
LALAARIALLRAPVGPVLLALRAAVAFLCFASGATAFFVLLLGGGSGEVRIEEVTAQIMLFTAVGLAAVVIAVTGREPPDDRSPGHLAVWVFRITMRRLLAAAAVGPVGLLLPWSAADGVWVIYGAGASILLMLVVAPTARRIAAWQAEIGDELDVLAALLRPYR